MTDPVLDLDAIEKEARECLTHGQLPPSAVWEVVLALIEQVRKLTQENERLEQLAWDENRQEWRHLYEGASNAAKDWQATAERHLEWVEQLQGEKVTAEQQRDAYRKVAQELATLLSSSSPYPTEVAAALAEFDALEKNQP